ncbi:response regulator transcription factor [Paenibacillus senegalensis]|uniref:response regulator transcription factor n=1 Tax=Paenibacillus senegalensis TaxID=1465766 RepID=UPI0002886F0F|nr:response regulator transcription factor [Paenibacillus senegalensis]
MKRIIYVEDEKDIGEWVTRDLTERGYEVIWLKSGEEVDRYRHQADLLILDVMLPGLDGFSIGRRVKKQNPELPILMLSARTAVEDKLEGLQFADDYLTKPFHPDELSARIEVLLRRFHTNEEEMLQLQHLTIRLNDLRIEHNGEEIRLTGKQYYLFEYFLRNLNRILTKEHLYENVWGEPYLDGDKTLMVHIRYLREKIELDPAQPTIIETIRGLGYRMKR